MLYRFMIPGTPRGKERQRFRRCGKHVQAYTPEKTVKYEKKVRDAFIQSRAEKMEGPINIKITGMFEVPKSISKKKKQALLNTYYMKKPDVDNIDKSILDGLNGVAYDDDKQVCILFTEKYYGEIPMAIVEIEELDKRPKGDVICPLHFYDHQGNEIDELFRRNT